MTIANSLPNMQVAELALLMYLRPLPSFLFSGKISQNKKPDFSKALLYLWRKY
jgi:hypothetical protein